MKRTDRKSPFPGTGNLGTFTVALGLCAVTGGWLDAAALREAKVTAVVNEVKLLDPAAPAKQARVGDTVAGRRAVRTGVKSRGELLFPDSTLLRLGANTLFSFPGGKREISLEKGSVLIQTPKRGGGVRVRSGSVTAAITGSFGIVSAPPEGQSGIFKFILVYGKGHVETEEAGRNGKKKRKKRKLKPWELYMREMDKFGRPVGQPWVGMIDIERLAKTSGMIRGIDGGNLDMGALNAQIGAFKKSQASNGGGLAGAGANGAQTSGRQIASSTRNAIVQRNIKPQPVVKIAPPKTTTQNARAIIAPPQQVAGPVVPQNTDPPPEPDCRRGHRRGGGEGRGENHPPRGPGDQDRPPRHKGHTHDGRCGHGHHGGGGPS